MIVRADLPRGTLAAQVVHAAGESSPGRLPAGTRAVVLAARDEAHLAALALALRRLAIPHHPIREPDPPHLGALMAIGIVPLADRRRLQPVTGQLPLLR